MMIRKIYTVVLFFLFFSVLTAQEVLTAQIDSIFSCISANLSQDYWNVCIEDKTNLKNQILDEFDSGWYDQCRKNPEILLNSRRNHEVMEKATLLALVDKSFQDSLVYLFKFYFSDFDPEELTDQSFFRYHSLVISLYETVCYIPSSSIVLEFSELLKFHRDPPYSGYDIVDPNSLYISCLSSKLTRYGYYTIMDLLGDDERDNEAWDKVILRLQTDSTLWRPGVWDGAEYEMD